MGVFIYFMTKEITKKELLFALTILSNFFEVDRSAIATGIAMIAPNEKEKTELFNKIMSDT